LQRLNLILDLKQKSFYELNKNTHHTLKVLITGAAIKSFDKYYPNITDKQKVLKFVKVQIECDSQ